jgi:two-component system response regulator VicR
MARILFIDDDKGIMEPVIKTLEIFGHDVILAATPEQALQSLRMKGPFDIIILDLMMANLGRYSDQESIYGLRTGVLLYADIRCITADVPVIVLTGINHDKTRAELMSLSDPPNRYLDKPTSGVELNAIVDEVLRQ